MKRAHHLLVCLIITWKYQYQLTQVPEWQIMSSDPIWTRKLLGKASRLGYGPHRHDIYQFSQPIGLPCSIELIGFIKKNKNKEKQNWVHGRICFGLGLGRGLQSTRANTMWTCGKKWAMFMFLIFFLMKKKKRETFLKKKKKKRLCHFIFYDF